jgi:thymidylate synthase (FAD)
MGTDALVVDAARVSFSKEASNYSENQNAKLISFLARHGHFTPFTHPQIVIREKVPIFVARQRFKHVVGFTYNEVSRRYVDDDPEFFTPTEWRSRPDKSMKQGSGTEIIDLDGFLSIGGAMDKEEVKFTGLGSLKDEVSRVYDKVLDLYDNLLDAGVAPEQARMVLPQSMFTEFYCTGSLAAWARAYKLRSDPHAQREIQELAEQWDAIIRPLFPVSWAALVDS